MENLPLPLESLDSFLLKTHNSLLRYWFTREYTYQMEKTPASSSRDEGAKQFSQAFTWNIHTNWCTSSKNSCRETQNNIWKLTVENLIINKHDRFHSAQNFPHISYLKEGPFIFISMQTLRPTEPGISQQVPSSWRTCWCPRCPVILIGDLRWFFWKKKCCKNTKDDESVVNEIISEMYNMDLLGINLDAHIYSWFLRHWLH